MWWNLVAGMGEIASWETDPRVQKSQVERCNLFGVGKDI